MQNDLSKPARLPSEAIMLPAKDGQEIRVTIHKSIASALRQPWPDTERVRQYPIAAEQKSAMPTAPRRLPGVTMGQAALRSLLH